jgi:DNA adenine methylase
MPYSIRKLPNQDLYRVYNTGTKEIHSYATTLENAKKQVNLLHMVDAGVPLEKQGGNFEEDGKSLKPFFNRIGSKYSLIKDIITLIPPHTTYVEPFVGGGSIFWNKSPAKKSVINDLDKELIEGYRILKRIPTSVDMTILDNSKKVGKYYPAVEKFINSITSKSPDRDKLLAFTEKYAGTFGSKGFDGIYRNPSIGNKWKQIDQYKALLKPTTIVSKDYLQVLKDYDSPTTFFFLDPPYEVEAEQKFKEGYYKNSIIDYEKMRDALKQLKGKFLLTINNSKYISDIFKDFNQKTLIVRNPSQRGISKEAENRKELFISNYNMPKALTRKQGGSIETDRYDKKEEVSIPEFQSVKIELPTYMYKRMPNINGKPPPYRFRLVNPITSARNIASRKKEKSIDIKRKPIGMPFTFYEEADELPKRSEFSPSDREKIDEYYDDVKKNEKKDRDQIDNQPANNLQRGFPLPCDNPKPKKDKPIKVPKEKKVKVPKEKGLKGRTPARPNKRTKKVEVSKEEEPDDLFAKLTQGDKPDLFSEVYLNKKSLSSRGSSKSGSSKSSDKQSDKSSDKSKIEIASISSISTGKSSKTASSKASKKSLKSLTEEELANLDLDDKSSSNSLSGANAFLEDDEALFKKYGIGIKNNISNNNKMANSWITYVKEYASKNGMSYRDALRDPNCKAGYKKGGAMMKRGMGVVDEMGSQALLANTYNDSELGANAGKKFISL